ncbi:Fic family protein [Desulforamulus putei DSM 12395]|uniref:Fic family protein n=1 Tax=Desulforamulus putei DSM 12395 TaxID=1121429 RepID=A0A1M4UTL4_9FIRM|nr:Fic family protein [Desulforamulus putei]SHE60062.1 Fic family protein [Desulforamulus putei DSM 12395]
MFKKIDSLKKIVEAKRPLHPELMATIAQKFREEWTYNSNAIEGNTMTLQETLFFLREGLTVQGRTLREHLEMINHAEAVDYLQDAIKHRDLTEGLIKEFHAILFSGIKTMAGGVPVVPGSYKTKNNHVLTASGKIHHYTPASQVPVEMEKLLKWYNDNKGKLHTIELAALFHHRFVAIHPFPDGNGRVGRLCMNFILMKNAYPPAIIRKENRKEYYIALEEADHGNPQLFINLVADEVTRNLQLMVDEIERAPKN